METTQPITFEIENDNKKVIAVINGEKNVLTVPLTFQEMNSIAEESKLVQQRINGQQAKSSIDVLHHVGPAKKEIGDEDTVMISAKLYHEFVRQNRELDKLKVANKLLLRERAEKKKSFVSKIINWLRHVAG